MEKGFWDNVSDNYLAERISVSNCEESLTELISRHSALCFKIIKKYSGSFYVYNIDVAEASSDKNLIIWNSAKSFSADKNVKFSTWLANQVKYSCLNALNKKSKDRLVATEDEILDVLKEKISEEKTDNLFEFTNNILKQLKDKRIKQIFSMRYSTFHKKPSWCKVAKQLNVSTQTAINLHNRGIAVLRKKITSEKFLDSI
ncbi:MAG TPA: sigma-70 family RNA polymerase sigma factor [Nitrospina sp.]|nr:sigma-70 family RNA polymerase sigma factor [Nitrospina sp.]